MKWAKWVGLYQDCLPSSHPLGSRSAGPATGPRFHLRADQLWDKEYGNAHHEDVSTSHLAVACTSITVSLAQSAEFTVKNLKDTGAGSLRRAIADANKLPGADLIGFANGLQGTITLTQGSLSITIELSIQGPALTCSGLCLKRQSDIPNSGRSLSPLRGRRPSRH